MKQHNAIVKFKNAFLPQNQQESLLPILAQDPADELPDKLQTVVRLYRSQTAENGYSAALAYRVIVLHMMTPSQGLDLKDEVQRFFRHCLTEQSINGLRMCFDLLLLKQAVSSIPPQTLRLLKAKLLRGLREYYSGSGEGQQKRKCAFTLREYCRDALQRDEVKRSPEVYSEILDLLIEEVKRSVSTNLSKRRILAAEQLGEFTQLLERSQLIASDKYQQELMEAYWALAVLHQQMHYLAYARKYAGIAFNIAQRTAHSSTAALKDLLERIS